MDKLHSIFNDVIGPIMRGPSSSHTAASWRIGRTCLDILNVPLKSALIDFDKDGAWATNYREQGTTLGINGGLLSLDIVDPMMKDTESLAVERNVSFSYEINSFETKHVNSVRLSLVSSNDNKVQIIAASLGGGAFEIQKIDDIDVSIFGDYFELIILNKKNIPLPDDLLEFIKKENPSIASITCTQNAINIKSSTQYPDTIYDKLKEFGYTSSFFSCSPILPIVSGNHKELPFSSIKSLLQYSLDKNLDLGDIGLIYEQCISGMNESELLFKMEEIVDIIDKSIEIGLKGTVYQDRILEQQSHLIKKAEENRKIPKLTIVNNIVAFVSALMESKSAMEVIVANPTAGSCGTVGGLLKAVALELGSSSKEIVKAYYAAGIIGIYFAQGPGFSAEEHGCQVECGAASGMAAAGLVQLNGGTAKQSIDAASMAIQNMIGLVCDPVGDRVEVPCLGKNISAAMNALSSATMALSDFDAVIPLEEVIQTVSRVSIQMPARVKCTGNGGLAITSTSKSIKEKLKNNS